MIPAAIDAAHWVFPFGWAYANLLGNLLASGVAFTAGFIVGYVKKVRPHFAKLHAHNEWHARQTAKLADERGVVLDEHPEHGTIQAPPASPFSPSGHY